jgi:hypothetical protein
MKKTCLFIVSVIVLTACQDSTIASNAGVSSAKSSAVISSLYNTAASSQESQRSTLEDRIDLSPFPTLETTGSVVTNFNADSLSFPTQGMNVTVRKYHPTIVDRDTIQVVTGAASCADSPDDNHYQHIVDLLKQSKETIYSITSNEFPTASMYLMVIENTPGYLDTPSFLKDLQLCGAGGPFPLMASKNWLVFEENNCAGGTYSSEEERKISDFCYTHFEKELIPNVHLKE